MSRPGTRRFAASRSITCSSSSRPRASVSWKRRSSSSTTPVMKARCSSSAGCAVRETSMAARHDAREERLAHAEHVPEVDRAPQHPTQHVAAALVAGQHAILDEERGGARVLRDHAQRPCRLGRAVGVIGVPGRRLGRRQHAAQLVGFVGRARALQYPRHAFEARAGVDVLRGQRLHRAVRVQVERHEHEVPDFEEVRRVEVDLPVGEAGFAVDVVAEVVVQLGARAARPPSRRSTRSSPARRCSGGCDRWARRVSATGHAPRRRRCRR